MSYQAQWNTTGRKRPAVPPTPSSPPPVIPIPLLPIIARVVAADEPRCSRLYYALEIKRANTNEANTHEDGSAFIHADRQGEEGGH